MTRINVVPPSELTRQHLIAEYRELPRIFTLAAKAYERGDWLDLQRPATYTLGRGHVRFFYDKLAWLNDRHTAIRTEMLIRSYSVNIEWDFSEFKRKMPKWWNNWVPTTEAKALNRERIAKRLSGDKT